MQKLAPGLHNPSKFASCQVLHPGGHVHLVSDQTWTQIPGFIYTPGCPGASSAADGVERRGDVGRSKNESLYDASTAGPPTLPGMAGGSGRMRNQGIQPLLSQPIWPKRSPLCSNLPRYSLLEIIQKRGQSRGYRPWLPLQDDIFAHFFLGQKSGGLW